MKELHDKINGLCAIVMMYIVVDIFATMLILAYAVR